jgi:hypothetical protein
MTAAVSFDSEVPSAKYPVPSVLTPVLDTRPYPGLTKQSVKTRCRVTSSAVVRPCGHFWQGLRLPLRAKNPAAHRLAPAARAAHVKAEVSRALEHESAGNSQQRPS